MVSRGRADLLRKVFVSFVAVILILGISLPMILSLLPEKVTVPDLVGRDLGEAKELARKSGLELKATSTSSADFEHGQVVSQKPAAGESVAAGTTVEIEVNR